MSILHPTKTNNGKRSSSAIIDPDYCSESATKKKKKLPSPIEHGKTQAVNVIINREYCFEINTKETQVDKIDDQIRRTKLLLHQLRYAIIADYYQSKYFSLSTSSSQESNFKEHIEHPAVKKNRYLEREIKQVRGTDSSINKLRYTKETILKQDVSANSAPNSHILSNCNGELKLDKEVLTLNSARCSNQLKYLIVVGNTSKYIGIEKPSDGTTHKWLTYVQNKSTIPIEKVVSKVRFVLHPSYSPNDVVDVE